MKRYFLTPKSYFSIKYKKKISRDSILKLFYGTYTEADFMIVLKKKINAII